MQSFCKQENMRQVVVELRLVLGGSGLMLLVFGG